MEISRVEPLTFSKIFKILSATHISADEKEQFIRSNKVEIDNLLAGKINSDAFQSIMNDRRLILFKPFQNSLTKVGDKKILANAAGIKPAQVDNFIRVIADEIKAGNADNLSREKIELAKAYAYRHGTKDEILEFLDYELSYSREILDTLYRTLSYNSGGVADYFVRPIHKMNNKTLISLYDIIDKNLTDSMRSGKISQADKDKTAEWALVRIYEIQNNQRLKNALKLRNQLEYT